MIVNDRLDLPRFTARDSAGLEKGFGARQSAEMLAGSPILSAADMSLLAATWDELSANSVEDNVYYTRKYAQALLGTIDRGRDVRFAAAWQGNRLTGLLPVTLNPFRIPGLVPGGNAWATPFTFTCMPVLDRREPVESAIGILRALQNLGPRDWRIRDFQLSGPSHDAFCAAIESAGITHHVAPRYERAIFEGGTDFDSLMSQSVPSRRRRDLQRNRRRLEAVGAVTHEFHTEGAGLERTVEAFLDLERRGWKGARGTALACRPDTLEFAREVFTATPDGRVRGDVLLLDGVPVAAGMIVFDGGTGFTIKGAYDEAYSGYSVGLLLELEVARSFLEEGWARKLDSATAGKHVIDFLWPQRQQIGDLYFGLRPISSVEDLARYERFEALKGRLKARAKRLLRR